MEKEMWEEAMTRLDLLSDKLGVAAQELWEILIRQAFISGIVNACLILFVFLVVGGYFTIFFKKQLHEVFDECSWYSDCIVAITFIAAFLGLITIIVSLIAASPIIMSIINPEYSAYRDLLSAIK